MRILCASLVLLVAAVALTVPAEAEVPTSMNYQVMLTDNSDQPLANQSLEVVFRIYDDATGGSLKWSETHNVTTNSIGVVSVVLGETTPLNPVSFDMPLWLQIEVEGEVLTPRRALVSGPYALHTYDSDRLGGVQASDYALDSEISGLGDGYSLDASDGNPVDQVYVNAAGNVGIGTVNPNEDLHIHDGTGLVYARFTNATTGTGAGDGFKIGINGAGNAYVYQYETADINFSTSGVYRGKFASDGAFELGNDLTDGFFRIYGGGSADPIVAMNTYGTGGGSAEFYDTSHTRTAYIEPDIDEGGAGFLAVRDGNDDECFIVDGNYFGVGDGRVTITGSGSATSFYTSNSGDASVDLPVGAVGSSEMSNEPGVASAFSTSSLALTGGYDVLLSRTINVPSSGYILAIATAESYCNGGATNGANFGVSTHPDLFPSGGAIYVRTPDTAGAGAWYEAVTVSGIFTVAAGSNTIYLLGYEVAGAWSVGSRRLSLAFFPTSYGTVSPTLSEDPFNPETQTREAGSPMTAADIAVEQSESLAANQARVDAELSAMREEIAKLKAELSRANGARD